VSLSKALGGMVKKILVIGEQLYIQNLFLENLQAEGFYTIGAKNGRIGIEQARKQLPNLIICNIRLAEMDGYSILRMLQQELDTAVIPFILVADKTEQIEFRQAMELGASDCLTMPYTLEDLLRAVSVQLRKRTVTHLWHNDRSKTNSELLFPDPTYLKTPLTAFASHPQLGKVFLFIEGNYRQPIMLGDVARAVGYSPAYLTNLTRKHTGQTVQRWIIERRMMEARSMLLETDQLVEQIAPQVGYKHVVHFFRQFRQLHGTTPQKWRSTYRRCLKQDRKKCKVDQKMVH
jgi:YesN/AraC family two-component response regulator